MRRVVTATALLLLLVGLAATPASAHDHDPPTARLRLLGQVQRGAQGSYCWTQPTDEEGVCVGGCADYVSHFPDPLIVGAGEHSADLILRTRHRPRELHISSWTEVEAQGEYEQPKGEPREVPYRLVRDRSLRRVRMIARITVPVEDHLYISVFGRWRDCQGCSGSQDSSWTFHLSAD
jgi:hypothetical protein